MLRIDALWLCTQPQDMRAGAERLLNVVVNTVGCSCARHGYLFANARASCITLLVWSVANGDALSAPGHQRRPVGMRIVSRSQTERRAASALCGAFLRVPTSRGQGSLRVARSDRRLQIRVLRTG